jgi:hypothetical protein
VSGRLGALLAALLSLAFPRVAHANDPGQTTMEVAVGAGIATTLHANRAMWTGRPQTVYSTADYARYGGSLAFEHRAMGKGRVALLGGLAFTRGALVEAEPIYQAFGSAVDGYRMLAITLGARFYFAPLDLRLSGTPLIGNERGSGTGGRDVSGGMRAELALHLSALDDLLVAFGSTDAFTWDASLATIGYARRGSRARFSVFGGVGRRAVPELEARRPLDFDMVLWQSRGRFGMILVGAEAHARLGAMVELGLRVQTLGNRPQGLAVLTLSGLRRRGLREDRSGLLGAPR